MTPEHDFIPWPEYKGRIGDGMQVLQSQDKTMGIVWWPKYDCHVAMPKKKFNRIAARDNLRGYAVHKDGFTKMSEFYAEMKRRGWAKDEISDFTLAQMRELERKSA